jgi:hypothetical protein
MGWITDTWRAGIDTARTWGREARAEWHDTVREITGPADADRWAAERAKQAAAGPTWLARDGGRIVEVGADGYPGREADPDDGRPVAEEMGSGVARPTQWVQLPWPAPEAGDQADAAYRHWVREGEQGHPPASPALDAEIDRAAAQFPEHAEQHKSASQREADINSDPSSGEWWDARDASEPVAAADPYLSDERSAGLSPGEVETKLSWMERPAGDWQDRAEERWIRGQEAQREAEPF